MPIAIGDKVYEDEVHYNAAALGIELPKEDTTSTTPSTPSEKPADALKMQEGTQVPAEVNASPERSILGQLTGSDGQERYQTFPERMVRGAISAMALPGDVLSGKVQPGSPQEIERAMDLAGLMVGGPAPVAAKMADGTLGSFAGLKSATLPKAKLYEAQNMFTEGKSIDDIWEKTGFFQGADGRWRYEIPDEHATLKDSGFNKGVIKDNPNAGGETTSVVSVKPSVPTFNSPSEFLKYAGKFEPVKLPDAIDHPELFEAYPHLKDINVSPLPKALSDKGVIGQMGPNTLYVADDLDPGYARSVMLHEIQHSIQNHEGFARGGSQEEFVSPQLKEAETFFNSVKAKTEDELMQTKGWSKIDLNRTKFLIRNEKDLNPILQNSLDLFKKKHSDAYTRLRDIVQSEDLLKSESEKQFKQYESLMGEVEARNVQRRMNMNARNRLYMPPDTTESVPRNQQIFRN